MNQLLEQINAALDFMSEGLRTEYTLARAGLQYYIDAVNWNQPFLHAVGVFHLATFAAVILSRHREDVLVSILVILFAMAAASSYINDFAGQHWESFSVANYFDKDGMFVTTVLTLPSLFNAALAVVCLFAKAISLMRQVHVLKTKALREQQQKQKEAESRKDQ
ncbi:hypothetical protein GQ42DRAFT_164665 [Ramicandelaber brevisporus]|nr:hypothetical protein GQ42DRAFT_164665 [Ramicandelaber brevisporus]